MSRSTRRDQTLSSGARPEITCEEPYTRAERVEVKRGKNKSYEHEYAVKDSRSLQTHDVYKIEQIESVFRELYSET